MAIWNQWCTNFTMKPSYAGSCSESAIASSSMFWLKNAIHAVPSDCSSVPPDGTPMLRSNTPMLSRPRKPPWNTLRPLGSLRLTHHVKLSSSLPNASARKSTSDEATASPAPDPAICRSRP